MKIKGSPFLFFILSVCFSQALALDLGYKSAIPADNKPSEEYLKKRNQLDHKDWNMEKLASDNALAEKRENERQEYQNKFKHNTFEQKQSSPFPYDWDEKSRIASSHMSQPHVTAQFIYDLEEKTWTISPSTHMSTAHSIQHFKKHKRLFKGNKRQCYRETRQKLEKEKGNGYSEADISDACGFY
ncbi:hypothetical protein ID853_15520 [Xenorhabdus sp. Vera]|uniref:hypothetical protein n=1 Tax=Xenorhabdus koppenhoeferi TaxID=351659 RepID=UPI0019AEAA35|nr:hypothetical protein [Xenorhabdus sp. Vera]MBD2812255.1 hypothetical protein [Xenorhabdus sp. Vera]